jgi:hypothetical protein
MNQKFKQQRFLKYLWLLNILKSEIWSFIRARIRPKWFGSDRIRIRNTAPFPLPLPLSFPASSSFYSPHSSFLAPYFPYPIPFVQIYLQPIPPSPYPLYSSTHPSLNVSGLKYRYFFRPRQSLTTEERRPKVDWFLFTKIFYSGGG